jgi:hypothetical protein
VPQRHFRMPAKKVVKPEQTEEQRLQHQQPETERYQLQIDRQTKRSFKTPEAARSAALEIKSRFPILQVSIYDSVTKSRTMVDVPRRGRATLPRRALRKCWSSRPGRRTSP